MSSSFLMFLLLAVVVALFVVWPALRHRSLPVFKPDTSSEERLSTNVALFKEHMRELDASLAEGRIGADEHAQLKLEHQRRLLEEEAEAAKGKAGSSKTSGMIALFVSALLLLLAAFYFYSVTGSADDIAIQQLQQNKTQRDMSDLMQGREPDRERARELITALEQRLEARPDNAQYWFMLARTAMEVNDFDRAVAAYRKILTMDASSGMVMAELAQALFLQNNNRITPEIAALAGSALTIEADNTTALGLAGIDAFERRAWGEAIDFWQRAVDSLPEGSPGKKALQGGVERARQEQARGGDSSEASTSRSSAPTAVSGPSLQVEVALADSINVDKELTVFVYARVWQGPKMPLAVQRISVAALPATITLDDSMAMSPMATLSQASQVELVARISRDGSAIARAGDWQGSIGPVDLQNIPDQLHIVIDQKLDE